MNRCGGCGCSGGTHYVNCEHARAARISANQAPVFLTPGQVVVEVVEPGTEVTNDRGATLRVQDGVGVRRGNTFFVTQRVWDALLLCVSQ